MFSPNLREGETGRRDLSSFPLPRWRHWSLCCLSQRQRFPPIERANALESTVLIERKRCARGDNLVERSRCAREHHDDDDGDYNDTVTCAELLLAFGEQSDSFNTQRLEAIAKAWPDPEEAGEVWAEYFEELADLFESLARTWLTQSARSLSECSRLPH